jgi:hypothetical protein
MVHNNDESAQHGHQIDRWIDRYTHNISATTKMYVAPAEQGCIHHYHTIIPLVSLLPHVSQNNLIFSHKPSIMSYARLMPNAIVQAAADGLNTYHRIG